MLAEVSSADARYSKLIAHQKFTRQNLITLLFDTGMKTKKANVELSVPELSARMNDEGMQRVYYEMLASCLTKYDQELIKESINTNYNTANIDFDNMIVNMRSTDDIIVADAFVKTEHTTLQKIDNREFAQQSQYVICLTYKML